MLIRKCLTVQQAGYDASTMIAYYLVHRRYMV